MIISIDAGGSLIKTLEWPSLNKKYYEELKNLNSNYKKIIISGGKSNIIGKYLNVKNKLLFSNETLDLALGASYLSNEESCYIVSIGTGTPIIKKNKNKIKHIIGTGVGAGTILGLSKILSKDSKIETINAMSKKGEGAKLNMKISDIYIDKSFNLPSNLTAGNFAKKNPKYNTNDLINALMQMVAESIASLIASNVKNKNMKVVIVGGVNFYPIMIEYLKKTLDFYKIKYIFPKNGLYANCFGALINKGIL